MWVDGHSRVCIRSWTGAFWPTVLVKASFGFGLRHAITLQDLVGRRTTGPHEC